MTRQKYSEELFSGMIHANSVTAESLLYILVCIQGEEGTEAQLLQPLETKLQRHIRNAHDAIAYSYPDSLGQSAACAPVLWFVPPCS